MSARKFNSFRKKSFGVESLEDRRLMAGDVSAQLVNNTLFINETNGANLPNNVVVSQLPNGKIRVAGDTAQGDPSRINGQAFLDFTIPGGSTNANLVVGFGGGNDKVRLMPGLSVNTVNINTSATTAGVSDVDMVDIQGLRTKGAVQIDTGDGVDNVFIQNSNIGDGVGFDDVTIRTGRGADYVQIGNKSSWQEFKGALTINTRDNYLEEDVDRAVVDLTVVHKWITVDMGGGNDTLDMLAVTGAQGMSLAMYGGNDTVRLREVQLWDSLFANLGEGNDTLDLNYVRAHNQMYLDGAGGTDTLTKSADSYAPNTTTANWETINGRRVLTANIGGAIKGGVLTRA